MLVFKGIALFKNCCNNSNKFNCKYSSMNSNNNSLAFKIICNPNLNSNSYYNSNN